MGMAGTGGTYSSSSRLDMEVRVVSVLGAGRREVGRLLVMPKPKPVEVEVPWGRRVWTEPVEVRTVL